MPNSAPQNPGQTTVTDAYARARAGEAVLLDVRPADEYRAGHAPGTSWQPLAAIAAGADLPEAADGQPPAAQKRLICMRISSCRHGHKQTPNRQLAAHLGAQRISGRLPGHE
jgi:rhodanese-related sulfurtransferase